MTRFHVAGSTVLLTVGLLSHACDAESIAAPDDPIVVEPIEVQSLDVTVGDTRPALVLARVSGTLGSGCDYLHAVDQEREGSVRIEILRTLFTEGPCTAILKEFRQELGLAGGFPAGDYVLRVNGLSRPFSVR